MFGSRLLLLVDDPAVGAVPPALAEHCSEKEWRAIQLAGVEDVVDIAILWTRLGAHRQIELLVEGAMKTVSRCSARHGVVAVPAPSPLAEGLGELLEMQLQGADQVVFLDRPPPQLTAELIDRLADAGRSGVGLLPDVNGGLIGLSLNCWHPELLDEVVWGEPDCARKVAERGGWCALSVGVLPPLLKVDEVEAAAHLYTSLCSVPGAGVRTRKNAFVAGSKF